MLLGVHQKLIVIGNTHVLTEHRVQTHTDQEGSFMLPCFHNSTIYKVDIWGKNWLSHPVISHEWQEMPMAKIMAQMVFWLDFSPILQEEETHGWCCDSGQESTFGKIMGSRGKPTSITLSSEYRMFSEGLRLHLRSGVQSQMRNL